MFTQPYNGNYQPLVHLSYALEHKLFKLDPSGYHITNLIFHLLNTLLVFFLFLMLTKDTITSLILALFFSLHPMQVESVAWISERKGLMCAFFLLISSIAYIHSSRQEKRAYYVLSMVSFFFALLAKPVAVTFPIILILFDYLEEKLDKKRLIEKIPCLILLGIFSIITFFAQKSGGTLLNEESLASYTTFLIAFYNIGFYIWKLLVPLNLSIHYEYPEALYYTSPQVIGAAVVIVMSLIYIINFKKINRKVNFGVMFFVVTLLPILRFIPIGSTLAADRYVYIPIIGFLFAAGTLVSGLPANKDKLKKALIVIVSAYLIFLTTLSYKRCDTWKNSYYLWSNLLKDYPDSTYAVLGLAGYYMSIGDFENARKNYTLIKDIEGLKRKSALYNIGISYIYENDPANARKYFLTLINDYPDNRFADVYMHLGYISGENNNFDEAVKFYEHSLKISPYNAVTHYKYALTLERFGKMDDAIKRYKLADRYDNARWGLPKEALKRLKSLN
jgi:tetratricopeptide (TPR) repeat protein